MEAVAPLSCPSAADQERGVKAVLCLRKAFCARVSIHFSLLKCVQGAGENELESVQCPAFLRAAITGDPQRQKEKFKQTKRPVLAALHHITVAPFDPFDFYAFLLFFLLFCALLVLTFAYLLCLFTLFILCASFFPIYSLIFCNPVLSSSHLISSPLPLFWII